MPDRNADDPCDHARFRAHVLPHLDAAYNLARWLTRNPHDAEDVVQDACVRAMRYSDSMRDAGARSWMLSIVRNAFYDWLSRNRSADLSFDNDAIDAAVDPADDPQAAAVRHGEVRRAVDLVSALPLQFREVLVLREVEDLSYKQIARIVDVPIGTVMSRLARARALLRRDASLQAIGPGGADSVPRVAP